VHLIRWSEAMRCPVAMRSAVAMRWSVGLIAAALSLALAAPGAAGPQDDKARVDRELGQVSGHLEAATERARQAAASYGAAVSALPGAQTAVAEAQGRVAAAEAAIRRANREAEAARAEQAGADQQFDAAATKVEEARAGMSRFATAAYKGGNLRLLDSLIEAGSPNEFAVRLGYLDTVADSRQRAVADLTDARGVARDQRSVATAANRRAKAAADAAERALANSRAAVAAAERATERVRALAAQRAAALATANEERATVLARYDDLRAESARIEAELRAAAARQARARAGRGGGAAAAPVAPASGAYFLMPVRGHKTSGFGMRFHPLFHAWIRHTGLDLSAGMGAPIVASADGEVANAGWRGGYGNYVCVLHGQYQGKGIATCYAHQSQILVRAGQQVRRGQLIGRVGSTGNSTGPHLHFEVRLAGGPVDPEKWLPACLC
jgi:murein DD-endopeptidase MepM/ murein hydrolase activator NlpD